MGCVVKLKKIGWVGQNVTNSWATETKETFNTTKIKWREGGIKNEKNNNFEQSLNSRGKLN